MVQVYIYSVFERYTALDHKVGPQQIWTLAGNFRMFRFGPSHNGESTHHGCVNPNENGLMRISFDGNINSYVYIYIYT